MPSGIEAGQAAQTGIPEKKRRKEAKPSPGSFQIHNAITGSWPKGNLQMNQVGQLLNAVRDVYFESEAAEKHQS
ncbi:hypothetical protein T4E_2319 [Trichinella pseudospiralis]|uniref:Uncharacterized protein n=1 Tax=Trichinella pseudospiralis TaxID=6337 RepID=A0A0V0XHT8_TRIPS|nr:hypothetical protein T4E_2319 [Trichinella pseudospiralis]